MSQIENWITDMDAQCGDRRAGRAISLNSMALKVIVIIILKNRPIF